MRPPLDLKRFSASARLPNNGAPPSSTVVWLSLCLPENETVRLAGLLSAEEKMTCRSLRLRDDQRRFLTGRILLRLALSHAVRNEVKPEAWNISPCRFGRPRVNFPSPLIDFNISHAGELIAIAVDPAHTVGIDAERLTDLPSGDIPTSFLSPHELDTLGRCAPEIRGREFIKLWTLKEALAKRSGEGLSLDFLSLDIAWQPGRDFATINHHDTTLETRTIATSSGFYQVSLARSKAAGPASWHELNRLPMSALTGID
jgi:phosphopantetheinyl transferase